MNSMTRDLVRAMETQRATDVKKRWLIGEARQARKARRRAERDTAGPRRRLPRLRWSRARVQTAAALTAAPRPSAEAVAAAVARLLDDVADRVVERGTGSERPALQAMADAARVVAPGAADALVDWEGSEAMRVRAFSVLHGVVLHVLGSEDQAWLQEQLETPGSSGTGQWVA